MSDNGMDQTADDGLYLSASDVAALREYLARAAELLDQAKATSGGPRFEALMNERAGVHTEMAGYLRATLTDNR